MMMSQAGRARIQAVKSIRCRPPKLASFIQHAHLWEIGAPFFIPLRPSGRLHRSLSLIRKSLTTAGWEHITVYCDNIWLTVAPNARSQPTGPLERAGSLSAEFGSAVDRVAW